MWPAADNEGILKNENLKFDKTEKMAHELCVRSSSIYGSERDSANGGEHEVELERNFILNRFKTMGYL